MKHLFFIILLFVQTGIFAQLSENLIPKEATSILSINNVNLLQKISLDELVQYRFMEELHHDIIDGSTSGWTLKDSGIDFDQKLNIFAGRNHEYLLSGITFGIVDKEQLFYIFDDFKKILSTVDGVEMYASYFNRLVIKGNTAILFSISPDYVQLSEITDSIWYARGNGYHWDGYQPIEFEEEEINWNGEEWEEYEEENWTEEEEAIETGKNYYELMDSVETSLYDLYLEKFTNSLFVNGKSLMTENADFKEKVSNVTSEGIYYVDNSANLVQNYDFKFMQNYYPNVYNRISDLYSGNVLSGNFYIDDQTIKLDLTASYGEELGKVYEKLGSAKFDKNMLPYIRKDNIAYMTSNLDLENAYELTFETGISILEDAEKPQMIAMAMFFDILNEYVNKDALFDSYKGGLFMTYNGIQKMKTKKIVFDYDEETFEYTEREEEAEEDMPIFAWGFTTDRHDIANKIMGYVSKMVNANEYSDDELINHGDYWEMTNGMIKGVSMYIINKNGVIVFTNDEDLAKNHSNGYGGLALSKGDMKKARKGGAVYGYADMDRAISELPKELFNDHENEVLDVFRGKSGNIELISTRSELNESNYEIVYTFDTEEDSGSYILDLINSLYVISK